MNEKKKIQGCKHIWLKDYACTAVRYYCGKCGQEEIRDWDYRLIHELVKIGFKANEIYFLCPLQMTESLGGVGHELQT